MALEKTQKMAKAGADHFLENFDQKTTRPGEKKARERTKTESPPTRKNETARDQRKIEGELVNGGGVPTHLEESGKKGGGRKP